MAILDFWKHTKKVVKPAPDRGKPRYLVEVIYYTRQPSGTFHAELVDTIPHYTASTAIATCSGINQPLLGDPDVYHEAYIRKPKKGEFDETD